MNLEVNYESVISALVLWDKMLTMFLNEFSILHADCIVRTEKYKTLNYTEMKT